MIKTLSHSMVCLKCIGACLALLLAVGCSGRVPADNPYDPAAPPDLQASGSIVGELVIARAQFDPAVMQAELAVLELQLLQSDERIARASCVPSRADAVEMQCDAATGTAGFRWTDIRPGSYRLGIEGRCFVRRRNSHLVRPHC